jgi:hypothetical protein
LLLNGDEFWRTLGIVFGNKIINGVKVALYPLVLCPNYMNPDSIRGKSYLAKYSKPTNQLTAGSTRFKFVISIGTEGKMKVKKKAVVTNLQKVIDKVHVMCHH